MSASKRETGIGETWAHFNDTAPDSDGAALAARLKSYGPVRNDLHRYVVTGDTSAGLKRALADAQRKGEWHALGVVRAACTRHCGCG